jgi:hypothetical protein
VSILEQLFPSEAPTLAWPSGLPDHLSASSLSMLERCPEQYRQRYVLGKKEAPSGAMLWGTSDGRAHAEANFNQKIVSHEDAPVAEVKEAFATILDEEVEKNGGASEIDWRDDDPAKIKDQGVALVAHYHQQVSPRVQPTATEERFSLDIPGVPVPFIGYIDVSTEAYTIERKTARGSSKTIPPHYRFQVLGYGLARSRPVELHISTRTARPAVYTPLEVPGLELRPWLASMAGQAERIIASRARTLLSLWNERGPDEPWPDAIGTMAWNMPVCDMCGFRPECSWWEGSVPVADLALPGFSDTLAGVTATPAALEEERLALTRTLLDIGDKRGSLPTVVAAIDSNMKSRPLAEHVAWLQAQLERATEVIA